MNARGALCRGRPGVVAIAAERPELLCARCAEVLVGAARLVRAGAGIVVDFLSSRLHEPPRPRSDS